MMEKVTADIVRAICGVSGSIKLIHALCVASKSFLPILSDESLWKQYFAQVYTHPEPFGDKRYVSERNQIDNNKIDFQNEYLKAPEAAAAVEQLQLASVNSWRQACLLYYLKHDGFTSGWVSGNAFSKVRALIRLTYFWDPQRPHALPTFAFELHGWHRAMGGQYSGKYCVGTWDIPIKSNSPVLDEFVLTPLYALRMNKAERTQIELTPSSSLTIRKTGWTQIPLSKWVVDYILVSALHHEHYYHNWQMTATDELKPILDDGAGFIKIGDAKHDADPDFTGYLSDPDNEDDEEYDEDEDEDEDEENGGEREQVADS